MPIRMYGMSVDELKRCYLEERGAGEYSSSMTNDEMELSMLRGQYGSGDLSYLRQRNWKQLCGGAIPNYTSADYEAKAIRSELGYPSNSPHSLPDLRYNYYLLMA